jgi:hypothetical protein
MIIEDNGEIDSTIRPHHRLNVAATLSSLCNANTHALFVRDPRSISFSWAAKYLSQATLLSIKESVSRRNSMIHVVCQRGARSLNIAVGGIQGSHL